MNQTLSVQAQNLDGAADEAERVGPNRPGVVYFVQATKLRLIKIGLATTLERRLSALRVGSPDILELLGVIRSDDIAALEARLHFEFFEYRTHGEWFQPCRALLDLITRGAMSPEDDEYMRSLEYIWEKRGEAELLERAYRSPAERKRLAMEMQDQDEIYAAKVHDEMARQWDKKSAAAFGPRRPLLKGKAALAAYKAARGL